MEQINEQLAVEYRASPMANKMIGNLFAGFSAPQPRGKKVIERATKFFLFKKKKPLSSQEHSPAAQNLPNTTQAPYPTRSETSRPCWGNPRLENVGDPNKVPWQLARVTHSELCFGCM